MLVSDNVFLNLYKLYKNIDKNVHGCTSTISGATWKFNWGEDEELCGVETAVECSELCAKDLECQGRRKSIRKPSNISY